MVRPRARALSHQNPRGPRSGRAELALILAHRSAAAHRDCRSAGRRGVSEPVSYAPRDLCNTSPLEVGARYKIFVGLEPDIHAVTSPTNVPISRVTNPQRRGSLAAARLEFAAYRASIQVFDPTSLTATFEKKKVQRIAVARSAVIQ